MYKTGGTLIQISFYLLTVMHIWDKDKLGLFNCNWPQSSINIKYSRKKDGKITSFECESGKTQCLERQSWISGVAWSADAHQSLWTIFCPLKFPSHAQFKQMRCRTDEQHNFFFFPRQLFTLFFGGPRSSFLENPGWNSCGSSQFEVLRLRLMSL